jgi:iron complex transport system substrate-binding protein
MKKWFYLAAIFPAVILIVYIFYSATGQPGVKNAGEISEKAPCSCLRIVSLSPNITETLFALGLEDRIAGVTSFCKYPPEAEKKPQVGGYLNLDFEAVIKLKPDIVFLLPEQENARKYLENLKIRTVVLHNRMVGEILESILTAGKVCGAEKKAEKLHNDIVSQIDEIKKKTSGKDRPKVLISVGRTLGVGTVKDLYIAGKNTSYDELITLAGGENVWKRTEATYPVVYREGLLQLDPDIIIDIVYGIEKEKINKTALINDWKTVKEIKAVKNGKIYIFDNDYDVVPGPRFILLLKDMAKVIHPEEGLK